MKADAYQYKAPIAMALLLCAVGAISSAFLRPGIIHCDSFSYCMGGLYQFVSHTPGYVGYCSFGMLVNQYVNNIILSFSLLSIFSTLAGVWLCFLLARSFGLSQRAPVLTSACYGFSICVLYFSATCLSYAAEGMLATLIAYSCNRAIRALSFGWAFFAVFAWALAGAVRPTTTFFLLPLLIFTIWRAQQLRYSVVFLVLAGGIVFVWQQANTYFLSARSGFQEAAEAQFWTQQVMTPQGYDAASLSAEVDRMPASASYHWPFVEVLAWIAAQFGLGLASDSVGHPLPSLVHAGRLAAMQACKLGFYLIFSAPILVSACFSLIPRTGRTEYLLSRADLGFLGAWIIPPSAFFVFGHFGSFGYLQVFLAGIVVGTATVVFQEDISTESDTFTRFRRPFAAVSSLALMSVGACFFLTASPLPSNIPGSGSLNVVAFQYTGDALLRNFAIARSTMGNSDPGQLPLAIRECRTDEELLDAATRVGWFPNSYYQPKKK